MEGALENTIPRVQYEVYLSNQTLCVLSSELVCDASQIHGQTTETLGGGLSHLSPFCLQRDFHVSAYLEAALYIYNPLSFLPIPTVWILPSRGSVLQNCRYIKVY